MGHIQGQPRDQITLFPECIDDYVTADNPVRVIDAFVDSLPLTELGFARTQPQATGRPPYHPGDLLKLYIYGYVNRVRSSRALEREAARNLELMWLLKRLVPDFKTVADFRKDSGAAIQQTCRAFALLCRRCGLFGAELVAIDGSKFQAVNARARHITPQKLKHRITGIGESIAGYLAQLDAHDAEEADVDRPTAQAIREKVATLKARQESHAATLAGLKESGEKQVSLTDPDARSLVKRKTPAPVVGYNVQIAVDDKHKLIVSHEVTNDGLDRNHLASVAKAAKAALAVSTLEALADRGYYCAQEVRHCIEAGITPYVPAFNTSSNTHRGLYGKDRFRYDPVHDTYTCPAGETLVHRYDAVINGQEKYCYETSACSRCQQKTRCTWRAKGPRRITRLPYEHLMEAMARRVQTNPEKMRRRQALAEHPFGTIKRSMNQGYFLMKRLKNVRTEMSLTVLAYNLKRVLTILGPRGLLEAMA